VPVAISKILALLTVLLLGGNIAHASDCKYATNKVDSFTKKLVMQTKWKSFQRFGNQSKGAAWMAAERNGDDYYLNLKLEFTNRASSSSSSLQAGKPPVVSEGALLRITMADGSVVEVTAIRDVEGHSNYLEPGASGNSSNDYVSKMSLVVSYELDLDASAALSAQGVTGITVATDRRHYEYDFGGEPTDRFQFVVGCIQ
jgi:hypothetical protein